MNIQSKEFCGFSPTCTIYLEPLEKEKRDKMANFRTHSLILLVDHIGSLLAPTPAYIRTTIHARIAFLATCLLGFLFTPEDGGSTSPETSTSTNYTAPYSRKQPAS